MTFFQILNYGAIRKIEICLALDLSINSYLTTDVRYHQVLVYCGLTLSNTWKQLRSNAISSMDQQKASCGASTTWRKVVLTGSVNFTESVSTSLHVNPQNGREANRDQVHHRTVSNRRSINKHIVMQSYKDSLCDPIFAQLSSCNGFEQLCVQFFFFLLSQNNTG